MLKQEGFRMNWMDILKQHISYTAVVLDKASRRELLGLDIPEGWERVAHHMTITMGALVHAKGKHDYSENYPVGKEITLEIVGVGKDDKVMAVEVRPPAPISPKIKFPHITVAVNREGGGKPFHAGKLNFEDFEPMGGTLKGIVTEVPQ